MHLLSLPVSTCGADETAYAVATNFPVRKFQLDLHLNTMRHRGRLVSIPRSIPRSTPKICIGTASRNIGDQPKLRSYKEATEYLQQSKKRRLAEIEGDSFIFHNSLSR